MGATPIYHVRVIAEVPDLIARLEALRDERGWTNAQLCAHLRLNAGQWSAARQGKGPIGGDAVIRILRREPALVPLVFPEFDAERAA